MTRDVEEREDVRHETGQPQQVEERAMGHRGSRGRPEWAGWTVLAPCSVDNTAAVGAEIRKAKISLSLPPELTLAMPEARRSDSL